MYIGMSWKVAVLAGQPLVFKRSLTFHREKVIFGLVLRLLQAELQANDMLRIYATQDDGKVYLSGTVIPRILGRRCGHD